MAPVLMLLGAGVIAVAIRSGWRMMRTANIDTALVLRDLIDREVVLGVSAGRVGVTDIRGRVEDVRRGGVVLRAKNEQRFVPLGRIRDIRHKNSLWGPW